jgi:hypothetical protein
MAASSALRRQAVATHDAADVGLGVGQCQQEHLAGDELVAALGGFLVGLPAATAPGRARAARSARRPAPGQVADGGFHRRGQRRGVGAGAVEQAFGPSGCCQHRGQHVGRLDVGVVARHGQALGLGQGLLEGGGELVETHVHRAW